MTLYRKQGRRYVPAHDEWSPAPGVWLVVDGRQTWFMKLGDPQPIMLRAAFQRHLDVVAQEILKANGTRQSAADVARNILDAVCRAEAEEKP